MKKTACPLDCYDACSVLYEEKRLLPDESHPVTKNYLCSKLNHYFGYPQLQSAYYKGKPIGLDEAIDILVERLQKSQNVLYFKGSGNVGKMQDVTKLFFARYGATFVTGSLCDAAGQLGIEQGRGKNLILPLEQVAKSELVVIWGRNASFTNSHLLPYLDGKTVVVIDPVKTDLAKRAAMHLAINPRTDLELACMLARFIYMQNKEDEEFIEKYTQNYDFFVDFIREYRMVPTVDKIGVDMLDIATLAELMMESKTVILVGNGVQKYSHGTEVVRMIDSLAAMLGLFGKEGCGVGFLGDTAVGLESPFDVKVKQTPKATVDFGAYDLCFIQGSNPAITMPQTKKVKEGLLKSFSVVFGLYMDETAKMADLVIPAKNFLQKEDIRFSYGHEYVSLMPKLQENPKALSEYELTKILMDRFGYNGLKSEKEYIDHFISQLKKKGDFFVLPTYEEIPYKDGMEFCFIDEVGDEELEGELFLITPKPKSGLNSQFKRDPFVYLPASLGFNEGERVKVVSEYGEAQMEVKLHPGLKDNCILAYSGSAINYVTPAKTDNYGNNAIFQEVKVRIERIEDDS